MLSSISNFVSSLFARPEPEPRPEPLRPATGMQTFLVTLHSAHSGEMTPVEFTPLPAPQYRELRSTWLPAGLFTTVPSPPPVATFAAVPDAVPVASLVEESDSSSDDDDTGSPKFGCWLPPRVGQSWPERLETLRRRAAAVGLTRIAPDMYAVNGIRSVIRVDEMDHHMLFPGEQPSRHPEFHAMRYMTEAEMAEESHKRTRSDEEEERSTRARD